MALTKLLLGLFDSPGFDFSLQDRVSVLLRRLLRKKDLLPSRSVTINQGAFTQALTFLSPSY